MIAMTIAVVSWALRETAGVTRPVVNAIGSVLLPLSIGFTIAYILSPVVDLLERCRISRLISSSVLYLLFFGGLVVAAVWLVPMVINQSTALITRVVEDAYYLDMDGDRRYDRSEPLLVANRLPDGTLEPNHLFADRNRNGMRDPGETLYTREDKRVVKRASIVSSVREWVARRGERFRILLGVELEEVSVGGLRFYHEQVADETAALDAGLEVAGDDVATRSWLEDLDPEYLAGFQPEAGTPVWPGRSAEDVQGALARVDPELRPRWDETMRRLGAAFLEEHRRAIATFDQLAGDDGDERARRLRQFRQEELVSDARERVVGFWQRLQNSRRAGHDFAIEILERLLIDARAGNAVVRDFARSVQEQLSTEVEGINQSMARSVATWLKHLLSNLAALLRLSLDLILVPIYAFFLTLSMPKVRSTVKALVPVRQRHRTLRIAHGIERVVASFFRGRLIVCGICAVLVYAGFALAGVPYAALFAICIGLATTVPLLGLLFLIPALMLVTLDGGQYMLVRLVATAGVYTVVQTLEAVFLTPTIMGREVELHPVVLIVAFLVFGSLWGLVGLILAVPIAATLRILAREFVYPRLGIDGGPGSDPAEKVGSDAPSG